MREVINNGWRFAKLPVGSVYADIARAEWTEVSLPHDFLIFNADDLYQTTDAWYVRDIDAPDGADGKVWLVRFDGIYMDARVYWNGMPVTAHHYGYTAFDADVTADVRPGRNVLAVRVRHQSPNSRWYSGAGIFRDVTLCVLPARHLVPDGVYATGAPADGGAWTVHVTAEVTGPADGAVPVHELFAADGTPVARGEGTDAVLRVAEPALWSCASPALYTLRIALGDDSVSQRIGFRTVRMAPEQGLFLNGEPVKLKGVCLHNDLGSLGSGFHRQAARRQLQLMRDMGVNAVRTSHNPPASAFLDLCDEMGILVDDELTDMWRRPKTTYDYARFFDSDIRADVASWVRRDRNHPCVILWSVGNEILDTHNDPDAPETTRMLADETRRHDPDRHAAVTFGSNYMPWEPTQRCAGALDAVGYNYGEKLYAEHHARHPEWIIYGSETSSILSSRGVCRFPLSTNVMSDEDLQCSSLGNSATAWGTQDLGQMLIDDLHTPYSMGQFLWSGTDYIGEPTPYHTRSCYFGMADTAGYPKNFWYLVRSLWTDEPMAHIGVPWDWNPGQTIDVQVFSTGAAAELFLNGRSLGRKAVDRSASVTAVPVWQVPFEAGELKAVAYDADGAVMAEDVRRTPGDPGRVCLDCGETALYADGESLVFVDVTVTDADGVPVENANCDLTVETEGCSLIALDNGDSADPDGYRTDRKHLFNGRLLVIAGGALEEGTAVIRAASPGLEPAELRIPVLPAAGARRLPAIAGAAHAERPADRPIRRIALTPTGSMELTPEHPETSFRLTVCPPDADAEDIGLRIATLNGITSPCAKVRREGGIVTVRALGDGELQLRATARCGRGHTTVISQQFFTARGFGKPSFDPYGFVIAGLYDISRGAIGDGNEQGITMARDGWSLAGFRSVDFGPVGSDEITMPVFALNDDDYAIDLYVGVPDEGGRLLKTLHYQKPSIWNVYQEETWKLPERLTGVQTICFAMTEKVHIRGFRFKQLTRAWLRLKAGEADRVYGDSFEREGDAVLGIGNNVSLVYEGMDFGESDHVLLSLEGRTEQDTTPVNIRFLRADGTEKTVIAPFRKADRGDQYFELDCLPGVCTVSFVFLPGCRFDFYSFRFKKL